MSLVEASEVSMRYQSSSEDSRILPLNSMVVEPSSASADQSMTGSEQLSP
jgi:hypothetical protein